jgi:hypothetical protein
LPGGFHKPSGQFTLTLAFRPQTARQVATNTDGKHYHVPGGANYQTMHDQLRNAFKEIADARPMQLVK